MFQLVTSEALFSTALLTFVVCLFSTVVLIWAKVSRGFVIHFLNDI